IDQMAAATALTALNAAEIGRFQVEAEPRKVRREGHEAIGIMRRDRGGQAVQIARQLGVLMIASMLAAGEVLLGDFGGGGHAAVHVWTGAKSNIVPPALLEKSIDLRQTEHHAGGGG